MLFFYGMRRYGKSNATKRYGACEACGKSGDLATYDTAQFFHLYWIPLIPVGHIKIIDACPHCDQCRTISPRKYNKLKNKNEAVLLEKLRKTPDDTNLVCEALGHWAVYNDSVNFEKMASIYQHRMQNNSEVLKSISYGYYRLGAYPEAVEAAKRLPENEPDRAELIEAAEAHIEAGNTVHGKTSAPAGVPLFLPYLVPLLIIVGVLGNIGAKGFNAGRAKTIWIINASQAPYIIDLDGTELVVTPEAPLKTSMAKGTHTVRFKQTLFPIEPFTFNYQISFWNRFNDDNTLVLNPDGLAFLINESVPYIMDGKYSDAESKYEYHHGNRWYVIPGIDYAFKDPPNRIDMYSDVEYKGLLYTYKAESYMDALDVLSNQGAIDELQSFASNAMLVDPGNGEGAILLQFVKGTNGLASVPFLQQALATRPTLIEWHRFYQTIMEEEDPDVDLENRYRKMVDEEPDEPALKYLLGRVMEDRAAAINILLSSEEGEGCSGYGYHAVAYNRLMMCDFKKAKDPAGRAVERNPEHTSFFQTLTESRLATQDYEPLLKKVRQDRIQHPDNGELADLEIRYLCLMGRDDESDQVSARFIADNASSMEESDLKSWARYFEATRRFIEGDTKAYLELLAIAVPDGALFEQALHEGNVGIALNFLLEAENPDPSAYIIAYCAAKYHGDEKTAKQALEKTLSLLDSTPELSGIINGSEPMTPRDLRSYEMYPATKSLFACALGFQHPQEREAYFELAQLCNYNPFYPRNLVNKWIDLKQTTNISSID